MGFSSCTGEEEASSLLIGEKEGGKVNDYPDDNLISAPYGMAFTGSHFLLVTSQMESFRR